MTAPAIAWAKILLWPFATVLVYATFRRLHERVRSILLLPVLGAAIVLGVAVVATGEFPTFAKGTAPLGWMLGPSTVALAVPLARQRALLGKAPRAILGAVAIGVLVGAASAVVLARLLGLSRPLVASLAPKSVTTPIAMPIAERAGGIPTLTAAIVVATGVIGMAIGPWLLDRAKIRSPLARGLALGTAAHGVGTVRAFDEGAVQGAASSVAMVIAGIVTAVVVPILLR
jgi:predicted murein hydrolase (TIGR00659 family)